MQVNKHIYGHIYLYMVSLSRNKSMHHASSNPKIDFNFQGSILQLIAWRACRGIGGHGLPEAAAKKMDTKMVIRFYLQIYVYICGGFFEFFGRDPAMSRIPLHSVKENLFFLDGGFGFLVFSALKFGEDYLVDQFS